MCNAQRPNQLGSKGAAASNTAGSRPSTMLSRPICGGGLMGTDWNVVSSVIAIQCPLQSSLMASLESTDGGNQPGSFSFPFVLQPSLPEQHPAGSKLVEPQISRPGSFLRWRGNPGSWLEITGLLTGCWRKWEFCSAASLGSSSYFPKVHEGFFNLCPLRGLLAVLKCWSVCVRY